MEPKIILEFYLLSLNPKTGNYINIGSEFSYGILGSILMDLYRIGKIKFQSKSLIVVEPSITNYIFFDKTLEIIEKKGSISVANLLARMGFQAPSLKKEVIKIMLQNNDITKIKKSFLGIPYNRYYPVNRELRITLIRRIRDILLRNEKPNGNELMLLSLIHVFHLYRSLSDIRAERVFMKKNMKNLLKNGAKYSNNYEQINELQNGLKKAIMSANTTTVIAS